MVEVLDLLTIKNSFRLLIFVLLFGYAMFSLLLMLRINILADTLETVRSGLVKFLAKLHLLMVIIGSVIVGILILF